ncbi:MAG: TVP38/TMEM64 family protein [Gammaproteobacteria bacterium]
MTIDNIKSHKFEIDYFISNNYFVSVLLFFISCIIFINSPIPLAAIIKLLGGFLFGFYLGALYNITATILACLIGFGISRYTLKEEFEKLYYKKLQSIENEIEKNGFYYFLSLRLVMVAPYFLINILAGISRVSFKKYLFSTTLGVIPASFIYANGGNKLEQISSINELFRYDIIFSIMLIALISLLPILKKNLI